MGIRYDRDTRRATNGPLIFFSDPSSKEALSEEIRGAIYTGLSFYCYRFPGSTMLSYGSSENYVEGLGTPGFVIGMFDSTLPFITIPYKGGKKNVVEKNNYTMPEKTTSFEDYANEVEGIISDLKNYNKGKVVAARVIVEEKAIDLAELFFVCCEKFPEAMIFCYSTPATGCWIGASPELLLKGDEEGLATMALAGTRTAGKEEKWDDKNTEEQSIVTDYIINLLADYNLNPVIGETYNKKTGQIEHICTPIWSDSCKSDSELKNLIKGLYPTPALCGSPKEFAIQEIHKYESFDRGCYGGFCGPFHSIKDFNFNVVLRCASVNERKCCYYAGGGITNKSSVEAEWNETALKFKNTFDI